MENFHEGNSDYTDMELLAFSPNMNPIKDVWGLLGRVLKAVGTFFGLGGAKKKFTRLRRANFFLYHPYI